MADFSDLQGKLKVLSITRFTENTLKAPMIMSINNSGKFLSIHMDRQPSCPVL